MSIGPTTDPPWDFLPQPVPRASEQGIFSLINFLVMVTVTGYNIRENKSGENFIVLELTGSLEIVQSSVTGNLYATVRRCNMPSTLDEQVAKMMVGSQMEGEIVRVPSEPYEYTNKRTGEVLTLAYSYAYRPKGSMELVGRGKVEDTEPAGTAPLNVDTTKKNAASSAALKEAGKRVLKGEK